MNKLWHDGPQEACGVFGIFAPGEDVARITYFGLYGLQHRGQESAGIAVADGTSTFVFKDMGLVSQVFNEKNLASLQGHIAIGHVRYSTTGSNHWENAQPIHETFGENTFALAHNGNLVNTKQLREELETRHCRLRATSDTEVIAALIASSGEKDIEKAIESTAPKLKGAFSLVALTEGKLIGIRDAHGIRPLSLGKLRDHFVISSETCGLDIVGAQFVRDILPGEMVVIDDNGLKSQIILPSDKKSLCIFEFIYFARPDSFLYGRNVYHARKHMGMKLAGEGRIDGDLVIPVPDSGNSGAIGYAERAGIPFGEGLIKNRYIGRTFIQPSQIIRQLGIRLKLNPLRETIEGKRLIVVDDSIVRGNTSKKIVSILRNAGAKEVHMCISSPPIRYPCFFGIDTPSHLELIASALSVEQVSDFIGLDSLHYLSLEGVIKAIDRAREDFCCACFNGEYPVEIPKDIKISKAMFEKVSKEK